jgi:hypothetical protein
MTLTTAFCPHCQSRLRTDQWPFPAQPERCPYCRLLIGQGRALRTRTHGTAVGSAAGVLANAARRSEAAVTCTPDDVLMAIREVADRVDVPTERLRMLDYQVEASDDPTVPSLGDVLTHFDSWKAARHAAVGARGVEREAS